MKTDQQAPLRPALLLPPVSPVSRTPNAVLPLGGPGKQLGSPKEAPVEVEIGRRVQSVGDTIGAAFCSKGAVLNRVKLPFAELAPGEFVARAAQVKGHHDPRGLRLNPGKAPRAVPRGERSAYWCSQNY